MLNTEKQIICNVDPDTENIPKKNVLKGEECEGRAHRAKCKECQALKIRLSHLHYEQEHGTNLCVPIGLGSII